MAGGDHTHRRWWKVYHQRILDGLEHCRECGRPDHPRNWLTFDHLVPKCRGRALTLANATILCEDCQEDKADQTWDHLISLAEEEAAAPRELRWALLAGVEAFRMADRSRNVVTKSIDGSAVTVYRHHALGMVCARCPMVDGDDVAFRCDLDGLTDHLQQHIALGQRVPEWVFEDMPAFVAVARSQFHPIPAPRSPGDLSTSRCGAVAGRADRQGERCRWGSAPDARFNPRWSSSGPAPGGTGRRSCWKHVSASPGAAPDRAEIGDPSRGPSCRRDGG
ncbi:hypothetical protein DMP17_15960 [Pseudonocardia sp. TMWB2A]